MPRLRGRSPSDVVDGRLATRVRAGTAAETGKAGMFSSDEEPDEDDPEEDVFGAVGALVFVNGGFFLDTKTFFEMFPIGGCSAAATGPSTPFLSEWLVQL